ncbi:unnamed protein product [Acanthoscelides obtectus]|uniref:Uncharacterized protein n=1 Tax=Acanthoscelides obtectus TaxID=200917 RepID=A0A9P0KBG8_ACAOB|nr:unnamed protein product [Acanthoscelides obtectus]CAK1664213.1 hypothetical protein AOBTE_LOCUS24130 [Acanthoscelides obtectus]
MKSVDKSKKIFAVEDGDEFVPDISDVLAVLPNPSIKQSDDLPVLRLSASLLPYNAQFLSLLTAQGSTKEYGVTSRRATPLKNQILPGWLRCRPVSRAMQMVLMTKNTPLGDKYSSEYGYGFNHR